MTQLYSQLPLMGTPLGDHELVSLITRVLSSRCNLFLPGDQLVAVRIIGLSEITRCPQGESRLYFVQLQKRATLHTRIACNQQSGCFCGHFPISLDKNRFHC